MATRVSGTGPAEMKLLAVRLREADPLLRAELRRNFRAIAAPVVAEVRASILSMPSHHDGTLRGEIARTVSSQVGASKTGVRLNIVSSGRKMPAGKTELPRDTDNAGWWHPVYGGQNAEKTAMASRRILGKGKGRGHGRRWVWVRQTGKPGWFEEPIGRAGREARQAVLDAMGTIERKLS